MHPVLGTMMPKICEAPHLPTSRFQPSCSSEINEWGAFISFSLPGIARALLPAFEAYPVPRRTLPKWLVWLVWLVAPLADKSTTRQFVARNVGFPWRADNSKSVQVLGMEYRPLEISIQDMFQQMVDNNVIPRR